MSKRTMYTNSGYGYTDTNTDNLRTRRFGRTPQQPQQPRQAQPREQFNFNARYDGHTLSIGLDYDLTVPLEQANSTLGGFIARRIAEEFARLGSL